MEIRSKPWALAYFAFLTSSPAADYKKLNLVPSIISDELIAKDRLPRGGRLKIAFTMASSRKACQACILCDAKVFSLSTHLRLSHNMNNRDSRRTYRSFACDVICLSFDSLGINCKHLEIDGTCQSDYKWLTFFNFKSAYYIINSATSATPITF